MMSVSQINTTVTKMLYALTLLEDTTASASRATLGTEQYAKVEHFCGYSTAPDTEPPISCLFSLCVPLLYLMDMKLEYS